MVSLLMEQLINFTDSVFLGHVGEVELGASAIATMYYTALYMLGFGFSLGMQVVVAKRNGEGRYADAGRVFWQGLIFLTLFAGVVFVLSRLFSPALLRMAVASDSVYRAAVRYVGWRDYSYLFAFPMLAFRAFFVGTTRTGILTVCSVIMVACNTVFNYVLIFGNGPFPPLGIGGAAIGSSLAELVGLSFLAVYMRRRTDRERYGLRAVFDFGVSLHLVRISCWTMVRSFFCIAPWFLFFAAIEHLGERELAAANIVRSVSMLFFVIVNSFATTAVALVGNLTGGGRPCEVMPVCRRVVTLAYTAGIPLALAALAFSENILRFFIADTAVIETAFYPFCVMLSTYLISVPAYIYCNAVIGTGNTRTAFLFQMINISLYLGYLFVLTRFSNIPLAAYWTAEQLYVAVLFVLSYAYMRKGRWKTGPAS